MIRQFSFATFLCRMCHATIVLGLFTGMWSLATSADDKRSSGPSDTARDDMFRSGQVVKVHLTLSESEYQAIQPVNRGGFAGFGQPPQPVPDVPVDPKRQAHRNTFGMDLAWATGTVQLDNQAFDKIGIRYKGNGTIFDAARTMKKSFKIDLDRFGGTDQFRGLKTINLHSGVADPSKCRETLGYALYRSAGVPAPRTVLAEVWLTVPGKHDHELLGLYTIVEAVDKSFLRQNYGSDAGLLMKPEGLREFAYTTDDWDKYKKQYAPRRDATPEEAARIIAFARLVTTATDDEFNKEITEFLDVEQYLRFLATTSFISNSDSIFGLGHNCYLYLHPRTQKLHFIPWDVDRAFANLPIFGSNNRQMDLSFTHPYGGTHRLTDRLLAIPSINQRYQALLGELAATCFAKQTLLEELDRMETSIKDLFARETKAAGDRRQAGNEAGPFMMMGPPPPLRKFFEKRIASLESQLAGKSVGHIPSGGFGPGGFRLGDFIGEPLIEQLDLDKNEKLSRNEWVAEARKLYSDCEKDADGRVDEKAIVAGLNGLFPKPPEGSPAPPGGFTMGGFMAGPIVKRADRDKDGKLTEEELVTAAEKLFAEFDKGQTGALDESTFCDLLNALFPAPSFGPPPPPPDEKKSDEKKTADKSDGKPAKNP